jgi:hypothetical protein
LPFRHVGAKNIVMPHNRLLKSASEILLAILDDERLDVCRDREVRIK